eukprot:c25848_g1_i2 orf=349-2007(-)
MGCSSSRSGRKQMPTPHNWNGSKGPSLPMPEDLHVVALTSSSYGILQVENPERQTQGDKSERVGGESMSDLLKKLSTFDMVTDSAPQSWLEVSTVLESLNSGVERNNRMSLTRRNGVATLQEVQKPETIDIENLMDGIVEDCRSEVVPPKSAFQGKSKPFDYRNISFHTVEELDGRVSCKSHHSRKLTTNHHTSAVTKDSGTAASVSDRIAVSAASTCIQPEPRKANSTKEAGTAFRRKGTPANADIASLTGSGTVSTTASKTHTGKSRGNSVEPSPTSIEKSASSRRDSTTANGFMNGQHRYMESPSGDKPCGSLFDSAMQEWYKSALQCLSPDDWNAVAEIMQESSHPGSPEATISLNCDSDSPTTSSIPMQCNQQTNPDPFSIYEKICPPHGENSVVAYITSLRGIRRTYEDCNSLRLLLHSFGVIVDERDVSMHLAFRNELRELMGKSVTVPRLFIKGRYIGGGEEVRQLHEEGKLAELLDGIPREAIGKVCHGCGGARFVPCSKCRGSCKIVDAANSNRNAAVVSRCPDCNENGLIHCLICSSPPRP